MSVDLIPGASDVGLELAPGTTLPQARRLARLLGRIHRASPWWIGDLIVFAEIAYGERYAQVAAETGLAEQTLMNYASVARRVPRHRRRAELSFSAHAPLAALSPMQQRALSKQAIASELHHGEIRAAARLLRSGTDLPDAVEAVIEDRAERVDVRELALSVWTSAKQNGSGYLVPVEPMHALATAIGAKT